MNIEPVCQFPATTTVLEPTIDAAGVGVIDLTSKTSDVDGRRKRRRVSLPASAADNDGDEENESLDVKRPGAKTRSTGVLKRKRLSLPSLPPVTPPTTDFAPVTSIEEPAALPARKRRRSSGLPTAPTSPSPQDTVNAKPTGKGTKTTQSRKRTRATADKPDQNDEQEEVENIDSVKVIAVMGKEKDKEMKKGACPLTFRRVHDYSLHIFSLLSSHYAFRFSFRIHQTFAILFPSSTLHPRKANSVIS